MSIATYEFSTFYTNIPQSKVKNVMRELINFCFKSGEKQFVAVTKFGAVGTEKKNKFKITFDQASLKLAINFLLDNCFLNFGNLYFQQITRILMDCDPATFRAYLSLYYYENKWLLDSKKEIYIKYFFLVIRFVL